MKLTEAESERLFLLTEECAEVIQEAQKILRHGYENHHPGGLKNRIRLQMELSDLMLALKMMILSRDVDYEKIFNKESEEYKIKNIHSPENKKAAVSAGEWSI